jgi:hypothetical protein
MPRVTDYPLLVFGISLLVLLCSVWAGATVCRRVRKPAEEARIDSARGGVIRIQPQNLLSIESTLRAQ